ncbi:MAG: hypothetical protein AAB375_03465 [Patescibacteria group bacterium]
MKKLAWSFVAVALVLLGVGIFESRQPKAPTGPASEAVVQPVADGNGVYYFPVTRDPYRRSLVQFYADNPGLVCEYQGATDEYIYPSFRISGHILHCHDSALPAQDLTVP